MNGNSVLLDSNILLYLLGGDQTLIPLLEDKQLYISFITQLELLGYKGLTDQEFKKIAALPAECTIIDINEPIKDLTIQLRKEFGLKLPDSIIIATSIYLNIPLISADKEFAKVKKADLILYNQ
jgi:predicted nucleic acid-binding protein